MAVGKDERGEKRVEQGEDEEERWSPDWKVKEGFKVAGQTEVDQEGDSVRGADRGERSPAEEEGAKRGKTDAGGSALLPVEELAGAAQPVSDHRH